MSTMSVIYTVETLVDHDDSVEFEAWQIYEHVPALLAMEGYFGVARFKAEGDECRYLNVWRVDCKDRFFSQAHSDAVDTPWKARIAPRRRELKIGFYRSKLTHNLDDGSDILVLDVANTVQDAACLADELRAAHKDCVIECLIAEDAKVSNRLLVLVPNGANVLALASNAPVRRFSRILR